MLIRKTTVTKDAPDGVVATAPPYRYSLATYVTSLIYFAVSVVGGIILVRFVLVLTDVNPNNEFVGFMMRLSHPLVAPFLSLFNYTPPNVPGIVEWGDVVALAVYAICAGLISRLLYLLIPPRYVPTTV